MQRGTPALSGAIEEGHLVAAPHLVQVAGATVAGRSIVSRGEGAELLLRNREVRKAEHCGGGLSGLSLGAAARVQGGLELSYLIRERIQVGLALRQLPRPLLLLPAARRLVCGQN